MTTLDPAALERLRRTLHGLWIPARPLELDLLTALDELRDWLGDDHWWNEGSDAGWLALIDDVIQAFNAASAPLRAVLTAPSAPLTRELRAGCQVPPVKSIRVVGKGCAVEPELFEEGELRSALASEGVRLRDEGALTRHTPTVPGVHNERRGNSLRRSHFLKCCHSAAPYYVMRALLALVGAARHASAPPSRAMPAAALASALREELSPGLRRAGCLDPLSARLTRRLDLAVGGGGGSPLPLTGSPPSGVRG